MKVRLEDERGSTGLMPIDREVTRESLPQVNLKRSAYV
jgi:hypothetical protein